MLNPIINARVPAGCIRPSGIQYLGPSMPKHLTVSAGDFLPERRTLRALRDAAQYCKGCDLWKRGTQTVFGEGKPGAEVMLVGEQPGNDEDLEGRPFVGPAGRVLDKGLEAAGIDRDDVYVTNAVKHFKWEPRGKRRIHKKPNGMQVAACRPWFELLFILHRSCEQPTTRAATQRWRALSMIFVLSPSRLAPSKEPRSARRAGLYERKQST